MAERLYKKIKKILLKRARLRVFYVLFSSFGNNFSHELHCTTIIRLIFFITDYYVIFEQGWKWYSFNACFKWKFNFSFLKNKDDPSYMLLGKSFLVFLSNFRLNWQVAVYDHKIFLFFNFVKILWYELANGGGRGLQKRFCPFLSHSFFKIFLAYSMIFIEIKFFSSEMY